MSLQPNFDIDFNRIPEAIVETLNEKGLSELAFADMTGVSQPVLNRIINGGAPRSSLLTFQRLWPHIKTRLTITRIV